MGQPNEPPPTTAKAALPAKEVMCMWWDRKGVPYYDLLPENQTINFSKYSSQLDQLKAALDKEHLESVNRKRMTFHQDDVGSCVSLVTRQKLLPLDWEVLTYLLYPPDIAPSDFRLFWSLQNSLKGKKISIP